ncbi:MAG: outer membrane beta-barrel family protein [Crocinitomicaceae bacterium]|nr:outer membrane beta-barrel family protein [Crocinitomicaceae bacterium]
MNPLTIQCMRMLCVVFIPFLSGAQDTFGIRGSVVDTNNVKIESGNVILLSPEDSTVLKGTHFWDGEFELLGISEADVLIKITADGYISYFERRFFTESITEIGIVQLSISVQTLEGVDVVYQKPMFQREIGKLIVNVEETILSERGTVLDLLRAAPNVLVKSDNSISVVGKGAAIIYLDGQRINSVEMLSGISSSDVSRIEVIDSPSARYDAEGNAVIEIITKKGAMDGYQGSIMFNGIQRTENQMWYRAQFSFRKKWFSMYFSSGQFAGKLYELESYHREVYGNPMITMDNEVKRVNNHKFNTWVYLDTDFRLDSVKTLFVNYNFFRPNTETRSTNTNNIYADGVSLGTLNSESEGTRSRFVHSISAGYNHVLDTLGSELFITGQYSSFDLESESRIHQVSNFGSSIINEFRSDNVNDINVYAGQADYTKIFSDKLKLDLGVKDSYVTNSSRVNFEQQVSDTWIVDSTLYNEFEYKENILAGYAEVSGRIKKFSYLGGVRYEWTTNSGNSFLAGPGAFNRDYHNIFPNVQLGFDLTDDLVIGATYSNRINRPSYQDLDPFVDFIDSLSSMRGNPQLRPAYSHNAELSLIYMEYASIKFGYTRTKDPMFLTVVKNEGTNTFSGIVQNIEYSEKYSIGLVIPYELTWWTTFNAFGYDFNKYTFSDNANVLVSNEPTFYISLYNEFRIPKVFNFELTYEYVIPGSVGIFVAKPYQSFGASITRKFFKDQFTVRFSVFDAFYQEIERAESRLEEFNVSYTSRNDTQTFMLALKWSFGKLKNDSMVGKNISSDEKERVKE